MSQKALPGFRDFYPDEMAERAHIFRAWREVARRYGFVEYDGPPLEPLDLYTKKSGDEIVGQLYNFTDKGDRAVSLRPEMTPTFARMVAARANALRKPVRWFSVPQLFRYERQQKGRLREHFQLNVDIVGEADVTADAELLAVAIDIMRELGLTKSDIVARVSDRRLLAAILGEHGVSEEQLPAAYAVIDKLERQPADVSAEKLRAAGISDDGAQFILAIGAADPLGDAPWTRAPNVREHVERLRRYAGFLEGLGVRDWVKFDLTIVRGLAYYTGIVFELFDAKGEFRAVCGGGRYDNLLQALGGVDLPALGFGMGDVVLGELLRARGLMPTGVAALDYWVASDDESLRPAVLEIATALRHAGKSVEYALREQALGKQLKAAATVGAREVVILRAESPDEVVVKSLEDGSERRTTRAALLSAGSAQA